MILLYTHIHADESRNIMTRFHKRTNTLYKKYTSHTLFLKGLRKGWCWLCVRCETETWTDCYILAQSSSRDHSSILAWLLNRGSLRAQAFFLELVLTPQASYIQLRLELELELELTDWFKLTQAVFGTWLYNCLTSTCFLWVYTSAPNSTTSSGQGDIPISSTGFTCFGFFRLCTPVHLLIDGSVEGQYVTISVKRFMTLWNILYISRLSIIPI